MTNEQKQSWVIQLTAHDAPFWVINKCMNKMEFAERKYGTFNPITDRRNFALEIEKELEDSINYWLMLEGDVDTLENVNKEPILTKLIDLLKEIRELR